MNTAKSLAAVAALLSALLPSPARAEGGGAIYGSLNFPMGDFADDEGEGSGNADFGFGAGVDLDAEMNPALDWTTSFAVLFNSLDDSEAPDDMDVDLGSWVTIPLLTGPRFLTRENGGARGYFQAQAGIGLTTQTDSEVSADGETVTTDMDWSTGLAFGFGAGILAGKVNLGLRFTHVVEHEHEITLETPDGSLEGSGDIAMSIIQFVVGGNF